MFTRTFALGTAVGVVLAIAGTRMMSAPKAHPTDIPRSWDVDPPSGAHFADGTTLGLDGRLGHASIPRDGPGFSTYVLATVRATDAAGTTRAERPPSHIALVIDRSGSMAGVRMDRAIAAAVGAVDRMHDGDRVTVVAFDTTARSIVPPTSIDARSRPVVQASIRAMSAAGATCISCALDRATEALDASPAAPDELKTILLISDGQPTTGVQDIGGLRALSARARDRGIVVSTVGVELDYDEKILAAIAQEANGRHVFVPDPSALDAVFDRELGSLDAAVATGAELVVEPAHGVFVEEVFDRTSRNEAGRLVFPLGVFGPGQDKTVLLKVHVPSAVEGVQPVAHVSLAYRDVMARRGAGGDAPEARSSGWLSIDVRDDGRDPSELDPFVAARLERSRTEHALLDANDLFAKGRAAEARAELARRQQALSSAAPHVISGAASLASSSAGSGAGRVDHDLQAQEAALARAQAAFGAAVRAAPASTPLPSTPAARSAMKASQVSATDLAF